jgi:hypothetical protein
MPRRPLSEWIADMDQDAIRQRETFRAGAEAVTAALARYPEVQAVALFGSVAQPPKTRTSRKGWEMLHHPKDVDLAVWIDRLDNLAALNRGRGAAVKALWNERQIGVAHHQLDIFLIEPETNRYLGRLCTYATCPKGKAACQVPGCGQAPLLQQHEDFEFYPDALAPDRVVFLYRRGAP